MRRRAHGSLRFDPDLEKFICEELYGGPWARPGIEMKTRSFITIAALIATSHVTQLEAHMRMGMSLGITEDEIKEVILQLAYYTGAPCAMEAVYALDRVKASIAA
ncbi:MAG: carboxymuconolactone decarboxylase family protein [Caulobacterales bacterium]